MNQLEQQLGTTASQVQGAEQAQANQAATATASVNKQLRAVRSSLTRLQNSVDTLNTTTATQGTDIKNCRRTSTSWTPGSRTSGASRNPQNAMGRLRGGGPSLATRF
jgi:phage shock protein A